MCVRYHQSSLCNCVTRKSPETRSIGVSYPSSKMQCCQPSSSQLALPARHSLTLPADGKPRGTSSKQALLLVHQKKTLTTLNFAQEIRKIITHKQCCQLCAKTKTLCACICEQISVSFISLSFIMISRVGSQQAMMMIANLNLNAAATVAPRWRI